MGCCEVVQRVVAAPVDGGDVVDGEGQGMQMVCLVVDGLVADVARWLIGSDDLAVSIPACGGTH